MTLDAADLTDPDRLILEYLQTEGRATPRLLRRYLLEEGREKTISRQYVTRRLTRLHDHGYVENVRDTGVYELVADPRPTE